MKILFSWSAFVLIITFAQTLHAQKTSCNLPEQTGMNCFVGCCPNSCANAKQCDVCGNWSSKNPLFTNCSPGDWAIIFSDEFEGTSVNQNNWRFEDWGNSYMTVQASMDYITPDGSNTLVSYNPQIGSGTLKIIAKQQTITARVMDWGNYPPSGCNAPYGDIVAIDNCTLSDGLPNKRTFFYTSGALYSNPDLGLFGPGKYEIRCKIPKIDGLWPAFWMYGACSQEIDVFEFSNDNKNEDVSIASKRQRKTYHKEAVCGDKLTHCQAGKRPIDEVQDVIDYSQDFHTFSVIWDAYQITWFVDGIPKRKIYGLIDQNGHPIDECNIPFGAPYQWNSLMPTHSMDIRVGMGVGDFCEQYGVLPSTSCSRGTYPAVFEIDYIRAWKRVPVSPGPKYTCTPFSSNDKIVNDNYIHNAHNLHIRNSITTDPAVTIENNANVWWTAGSYMEFAPGFNIESGAKFTAEIAPCEHGFFIPHYENGNPLAEYHVPISGNYFSKDSIQVKPKTKLTGLVITPNPSDGIFQLNINEMDAFPFSLTIFNGLGKVLHQQLSNSLITQIDISQHPKGIYFIKVQTADEIYTGKVVVR